jgi:hypothetical protein
MGTMRPIRTKSKRTRRRARQLRSEVAPVLTGASAAREERLFDEPATPARRSVVPVEEPIEPSKRAQDPAVCGDPDASRTEASDLH